MTKQNEIETLLACAKTLGGDSYCGPWLLDQIPQIEAEIRSDLLPMVSYSESRLAQDQMREQVKADCDRMFANAKKEAEQIIARAETHAKTVRDNLRRDLQRAADIL
jgi:hypothetical protein